MSEKINCANLKFCVERAMKYVDSNNYNSAIDSFISDASKSQCTKHISEAEELSMMILTENIGNPEKFKESLLRLCNDKYLKSFLGFYNNCSCYDS